MRSEQRVIVTLPLTEIWDDAGPVLASRGRRLGPAEIAELLRLGSVQFIVAATGALRWVPLQETYSFWKAEVKQHLVAANEERFHSEEYPDQYCYMATEWERPGGGAAVLVLLEQHH